jgi:hypothetical protein
MVEQILPNSNEMCYSNFSPIFHKWTHPQSFTTVIVQCRGSRAGMACTELTGTEMNTPSVVHHCHSPVQGQPGRHGLYRANWDWERRGKGRRQSWGEKWLDGWKLGARLGDSGDSASVPLPPPPASVAVHLSSVVWTNPRHLMAFVHCTSESPVARLWRLPRN